MTNSDAEPGVVCYILCCEAVTLGVVGMSVGSGHRESWFKESLHPPFPHLQNGTIARGLGLLSA